MGRKKNSERRRVWGRERDSVREKEEEKSQRSDTPFFSFFDLNLASRPPPKKKKKKRRTPLQLPGDAKLSYFDAENTMQEISVDELTRGKRVVLFAVPGAFTPTCSLKHLPGFIEKSDELRAKGVDAIACVSVNDPFVMDAWGRSVDAGDKVLLLADGSALFTKAIGAELDLTDKGLGIRSRRYAALVEDGTVKLLNLEEGGAFTVSSADEILAAL